MRSAGHEVWSLRAPLDQTESARDNSKRGLIQSRFSGDIASDLEVQQAQTQLETTRPQAIDVGVARAQCEHAVAILIGKPPASFNLAPLPLTMPPTLWVGGPSAVFTIFDVGRRRAASDQAVAAYDQAVANYRQIVLTGFQQVEDNVAALRILEHEAEIQDKAVAAAQKYLELAITRYKGGVTSYLEVTTAQSAALTDELTAVNGPA